MIDKVKPQRMCIACRQMKDKNQLLRIVKSPDGCISLDLTFKKNGRGAYVCNDVSCVNRCVKQRAINRTFKCEVDSSVYNQILEDFSGGNSKRQN